MPRDHFGEDVAARYDETSASMFDPTVLGPTVDLLAELAGDGRALEFAIGTGRVALPLAARGVPVLGAATGSHTTLALVSSRVDVVDLRTCSSQ